MTRWEREILKAQDGGKRWKTIEVIRGKKRDQSLSVRVEDKENKKRGEILEKEEEGERGRRGKVKQK